MTVRRLRAKQRGPKCNHCTERAVWRGVYFTRFACDDHLDHLEVEDQAQSKRDSYQSEAEWGLGV